MNGAGSSARHAPSRRSERRPSAVSHAPCQAAAASALRATASRGTRQRLRCERPMTWWRTGILYQIYPRSFADSDGDGVGDLRGIVERLDHLEWLGVDGIWLNPTFPSPNADWGYDVSDYYGVHPDLGTADDLQLLIDEVRARKI